MSISFVSARARAIRLVSIPVVAVAVDGPNKINFFLFLFFVSFYPSTLRSTIFLSPPVEGDGHQTLVSTHDLFGGNLSWIDGI